MTDQQALCVCAHRPSDSMNDRIWLTDNAKAKVEVSVTVAMLVAPCW